MKRYAWWNQYGSVPIAQCVQRAKDAQLDAVIVKSGYTHQRDAFATAGVPWATEAYVYPEQPAEHGRTLAADIARGARFAVINAEAEWETLDAAPMAALIAAFRAAEPAAPLYACTDTRGDRMNKPYQRVMADQCDGWMPMIYPKAFEQTPAAAFAAALDGKDLAGKPVIPAIQTYDNIGAPSVALQITECERRGLAGFGAYTIGHATDTEWSIIMPYATPQTTAPTKRETQLARLNKTADIFTECAQHALRGEQLPNAVAAAAKYLLS